VSEPYYSQRVHSVCISLSAFFVILVCLSLDIRNIYFTCPFVLKVSLNTNHPTNLVTYKLGTLTHLAIAHLEDGGIIGMWASLLII